MKGLLKGLRKISEIFEADNEKEPEIQIGAPTDVKHVAHIGNDGPSNSAPSWMSDYQGSGSSDKNSGSTDSMKTPDRHGKSRQSNKQAAHETSHGRRAKNPTAESGSPSQESGAKKNRRKKRASARDSSSTSNVDDT